MLQINYSGVNLFQCAYVGVFVDVVWLAQWKQVSVDSNMKYGYRGVSVEYHSLYKKLGINHILT